MRHAHLISAVALVAATALFGCKSDTTVATNGTTSTGSSSTRAPSLNLPSGSQVDITLGTAITSETAAVGNAWNGTVRNSLSVDGRNAIPAGSVVAGTVTGVTPAKKGDLAMLDLGLTSITVGDRTYHVHGSMESVVAGSPRARNLGAIGAATVAGAIIGHQVGHSDKGTIVGGLIGGGVATGVVSQTKGYQVELKAGTPLTFTTSDAVAVRY